MIPQNVKDVVKTALESRLVACVTEIKSIQDYLDGLGYDGDCIVRNALETDIKEEVVPDGILNSVSGDTPQPFNLVTKQPILKKQGIGHKKHTSSVSKFRGVTKQDGTKWRARLHFKGKNYELGVFPDEIDAARAYDDAKVKLTKSTKSLNIPERYKK